MATSTLKTYNLSHLWKQVEEALLQSISRDEYQDWFADVRILEYDGHSVVLGVSQLFYKQYIEQTYQALLRDIFYSLIGQPIEINFRLNPLDDFSDQEAVPEAAQIKTEEKGEADVQFDPLNANYVFDNFVVGSSNKMAHAAAEAVAQKPSESFNPLFVYGGVGLGKTHLMQAIGNATTSIHPNKRVAYLSAEQFVNIFIDAIKRNARLSFQATFRNVDVLLIDDIQFLAGKESTQEEFFHTFNALYNRRKQIVISSDRPPKDIPTIEDRLRSRFEWGLLVDIGPPDFEMRMAILSNKCEQLGVQVDDEVLRFVASKIRSSVRELEGALYKITAHSRFTEEKLTIESAAKALGEIFDRPVKDISIEKIQRKVAEFYSIKPSDIIGKNRSRSIARPRQVAMYLSRKLTHHSYPEIGTFFGNKDHTTVLFACNKIEQEMQKDNQLKSSIEQITELFSRY